MASRSLSSVWYEHHKLSSLTGLSLLALSIAASDILGQGVIVTSVIGATLTAPTINMSIWLAMVKVWPVLEERDT